jgi:subtilisin-like proprotein convertase family protein
VLSESTTISGCSTIDFLTVYADVEHDYDMDSTTVVLESPSGTLSMLAGREFAPRVTRVAAIYPFERQPDTPLSVMHGEVGDGTWTLYVHNRLSIEDATLHSWSVNLYCN